MSDCRHRCPDCGVQLQSAGKYLVTTFLITVVLILLLCWLALLSR